MLTLVRSDGEIRKSICQPAVSRLHASGTNAHELLPDTIHDPTKSASLKPPVENSNTSTPRRRVARQSAVTVAPNSQASVVLLYALPTSPIATSFHFTRLDSKPNEYADSRFWVYRSQPSALVNTPKSPSLRKRYSAHMEDRDVQIV